MNLFLIGYRCTGKTTVGRRLAERLSWAFVDADAEVVDKIGMPIAAWVEKEGWPAFRRAEKEVLGQLCRNDRQVVATGGGVVLEDDNVRKMRSSGRTVWLKAEPGTILRRMRADAASPDQRPPLTDKDLEMEIRDTLAQRRKLYEAAADMAVDTDRSGIDAISEVILSRLREAPDSAPAAG